MENVNEVALKRRKTNLNNKSKEELIAIILRKDDVEKKQATKITNLTEEVKNKENHLTNVKNDLLRLEKDCGSLVNQISTKYNKLKSENQDINEKYVDASRTLESYKEDVQDLKKVSKIKTFVISGLVILAIICMIF